MNNSNNLSYYTNRRVNALKELVYAFLLILYVTAGIYLRSLQVDKTFFDLTTVLLLMSILGYTLCFFLRNLKLGEKYLENHKIFSQGIIFILETLTLLCLISLAIVLVLCGPLLFTNIGIVIAYPKGLGNIINTLSLISLPLIIVSCGVGLILILLIVIKLKPTSSHTLMTLKHNISYTDYYHIRSNILNFGYFYRYSAYE